MRHENCTVYLANDSFGNYTAFECKHVEIEEIGTGHVRVWQVRWLLRGKRAVRGFTRFSTLPAVVAKGWNLPKPASMFGEAKPAAGGLAMVSEGRYESFSPGWKRDFYRDVIPAVEVLADYHEQQPTR